MYPWDIEQQAPDLWMERWWAWKVALADARKPTNEQLRAQATPMPMDEYMEALRQSQDA
jgi:hypothetical protein